MVNKEFSEENKKALKQKKINSFKKSALDYNKMKKVVIKIHEAIEKLPEDKLIQPKFRKYVNPGYQQRTKNAYVTLLMIDEIYLPGVLTLGYSLKKYKVKQELVCLVQDKPSTQFIKGKNVEYPGVSKKAIEDILKIYDVVYGIDLLNIPYDVPEGHFTNIKHYENINIYATKLQILGVLAYDKILYIDASTIVTRNLDYIFKFYSNKSVYRQDILPEYKDQGLAANTLLIVTSLKQYNQGLYLFYNYHKLFRDTIFTRGIDEILLYFAIYPKWDYDNLLKRKFLCPPRFQHFNCPISQFGVQKPFRSGVDNRKNDYTYYNQWDDITKEFLSQFPQFCHYYSHISTFRDFTLPSSCN